MGNDGVGAAELTDLMAEQRRVVAAAEARLAGLCVEFADARRAELTADRRGAERGSGGRARVGEFVADEVSVVLGVSSWEARCLVARSRRVAEFLPVVWAAAGRGEIDAERVREVDRVARLVQQRATLDAIDDGVVAAAKSRTVRQLRAWLER